MGWFWRKRQRLGPVNLNYSTRGVGTSIGIPGFRFGVTATGQRYISLGIPGTGLYYTKYFSRQPSPAPPPPPAAYAQQPPAPPPAISPTSPAPPAPPQASPTGSGQWWTQPGLKPQNSDNQSAGQKSP